MTVKENKTSGLCGKMRALQDKCRSASAETTADMLAVVSLAEQCLNRKHQVTTWEPALAEVKRKWQAASCATVSAQHSALARMQDDVRVLTKPVRQQLAAAAAW